MGPRNHENTQISGGFSPCPHRNAYQPEGTAILSGAIILAIIVINCAIAQCVHVVLR